MSAEMYADNDISKQRAKSHLFAGGSWTFWDRSEPTVLSSVYPFEAFLRTRGQLTARPLQIHRSVEIVPPNSQGRAENTTPSSRDLKAVTGAAELATPTAENCKWCPFKLLCHPFWNAVKAAWSGQLDGAAVEGILDEPPLTIHAALLSQCP